MHTNTAKHKDNTIPTHKPIVCPPIHTHLGEDVPGLMEGGHSLPVEEVHESKPGTVGLHL